MKRLTTFVVSLFVLSACLQAQVTTLKGLVQDELTREPLVGVEVRLPLNSAFTGPDGRFELAASVANTTVVLSFVKDGFEVLDEVYEVGNSNVVNVGVINLQPKEDIDQIAGEDLIPTVTLSIDDGTSQGAQNISGLLTASRDRFTSTAAFVFGRMRFRIRGYNSENTAVFMNGVPVNDLEGGRVFWGNWGGLNDVLRGRTNTVGLGLTPYAFGGVGGSSAIDTRASRQRKQVRASYAVANTSYRNRVMLTYNTGMLESGWAFSFSGSRRWAQEGYIEGTPYDAYSYFLSVDKQIGDNHLINLTAFGTPTKRGRSTAAIQELYDLAGTNYYNRNWGFQNGEKRNASVADNHQPVAILRHDWKIGDFTTVTTAASFQTGEYSISGIDWLDSRDPRPDYYRNLPSFINNEQAEAVADILRNDANARQVDWDYMYRANRNTIRTIEDVDGIAGNDVTGRRAGYIVEERHFDNTRFNFNTYIESVVAEGVTISAGANYQYQVNHQYKEVNDLMGADFYLDIDRFAAFDSLATSDFVQNDIENPNRLIREGDIFGYNQEVHNQQVGAFIQGTFSTRLFDFFLGVNGESKSFWRNGLVANGKFPTNSKGESERSNFFDYGVKGGATLKIDGRNYVLLNGTYMKRAPFARNAFTSVRTRNDLVDGLTQETIFGFEGGYILKSPNVKARAMAFYTEFRDQLNNRSFFLDDTFQGQPGGFVNFITSGIDTRHMGLELSTEVKVGGGLSVSAVAAIGKHVYTSRPDVSLIFDQNPETSNFETEKAFIKNYNVPSGPQTAYSLGLHYNSPNFWFANVNFNYFDNVWIDFFPLRRTLSALATTENPQFQQEFVTEESDANLYNSIIEQEKVPGAFTVDFFGGKSWKIDDFFIYLTVGVSNILDNQDFITGGYEQFRFDFENKDTSIFPNRYFYAFGRTYFINLAFKI
ncbi:MAG: TonB-dependent receptor [Bacteroidota bacterium]